jgi:hypothetical protein
MVLIVGIALFPHYFQTEISRHIIQTNSANVLGSTARIPEIYVSSYNEGYNATGVIELASTAEPAMVVNPNNAAMIAITKNVTAQLNIGTSSRLMNVLAVH